MNENSYNYYKYKSKYLYLKSLLKHIQTGGSDKNSIELGCINLITTTKTKNSEFTLNSKICRKVPKIYVKFDTNEITINDLVRSVNDIISPDKPLEVKTVNLQKGKIINKYTDLKKKINLNKNYYFDSITLIEKDKNQQNKKINFDKKNKYPLETYNLSLHVSVKKKQMESTIDFIFSSKPPILILFESEEISIGQLVDACLSFVTKILHINGESLDIKSLELIKDKHNKKYTEKNVMDTIKLKQVYYDNIKIKAIRI